MLTQIRKELHSHSSKEKAKILQRFFKTGKGEYAEGDIFLGITVPVIRKLADKSLGMSLKSITNLLKSAFHEERLLALLVLVKKFNTVDELQKKQIYLLYLKNTKHINNWDLVDLTAGHIAGAYLFDKNKSILYTLANSDSLWERRISIIATFYFIRKNQFEDIFKITEIVLDDREDLIHKACGWMLREVGKRKLRAEEGFLRKHYHRMPRTMLRYAIEKFPEVKRQKYLKGLI